MLLHQSDLKAWARCPQQWHLQNDGHPRGQLSATAYGSVMHHALHVFERTRDVEAALATFIYYWNPLNIEVICEPVTIWIANDTYGEMLLRGQEAIKKYVDLGKYAADEVLALEFEFVVPIHGTTDRVTGGPHHLGGTVDRLKLSHYKRRLTVGIDDFKTGKRPAYIRQDLQGTAYAYATLQPEFWLGNPEFSSEGFGPERGAALINRITDAPRRFTWIDMKKFGYVDGGFRGELDYSRFTLCAQQVADSMQAKIFPLSISGEHCQYCPYREICGGVGMDDADGDPGD